MIISIIKSKLINISNILIITIGVIGCTYNKGQNDIKMQKDIKGNFYSENCKQFEDIHSSFWWDTKIIKQERSKLDSFYEPSNLSSNIFSGIQSVQLKNSLIKINIIDKILSDEYSAPIVDKVKQLIYENTGCIQNEIIESELDKSKKIKTGKAEWKDAEINHKILVSGFDKNYEFIIKKNSEVDLKNAILSSNLAQKNTITITCIDCVQQDNIDKSNLNIAKKSTTLTYDFRSLKQKLLKDEEQRLISEQQLAEKESSMEKLKLKEERQKQGGVPLDDFKNKCLALDFKLGTKDFGDCVLKLNEIK
jgi:hypothetical protein